MARISAEQRRQDLTEAAFRVMARVGVPAATTRLIAEEAGVPQSVFHYCFRSKRELFQQLTKVVVDAMVGEALGAVVEADTLEESVRRSLRGMWENAAAHPDRQLVLYELTTAAMREPGDEDLARWQYEQYFAHTGRLLEELARRHDIAWTVPLAVLSRMTTTMIDGVILGWITDKDTDQVLATLDLCATCIAALSKPS